MNTTKLSWDEIVRQYNQEWVELIDYDWPDTAAYPTSGIVRVHAKTRFEFDNLADIDPPFNSAYIFVGQGTQSNSEIITRGFSRIISGTDNA